MAQIDDEYRLIVRTFNRNMAEIRKLGYTGARSYQNMLNASQTSRYRNLFRVDKNGNTVLRTDFTRLSEAEIDNQMKVMLRTLDAGAYTVRQLKQEYKEYEKTHKDEIDAWEKKKKRRYSMSDYMDIRESISEDSIKRFYYDVKTHSTTQAVENNVSTEEAIDQLVSLAMKGKQSPITGNIYPSAIQNHLNKLYGE